MEDDGEQEMDADVEMSQDGETDENASPTAHTRPHPNRHTHARRTVEIVDDSLLTTAEGGQQPSDSIVDTDMDAWTATVRIPERDVHGRSSEGVCAYE